MDEREQVTEAKAPGDGPTCTVSVSLHAGTIGAVRHRVGRRGVSSYVEAAVRRQIERDNLAELIAAAEGEHGPLADEEVEAAVARLDAATRQTGAA